jgi:hypothetical protein
MSSMTQKEHEQADAEGDRQDACYDTALAEYFSSIELIKQSFEHNLNDTPIQDVPFHVIKHMADSVVQMVKKSNYHFVDDYDDIHYDFESELLDMLLDEYGWEI